MDSCALVVIFVVCVILVLCLGLGNMMTQVAGMMFDIIKIVLQSLINALSGSGVNTTNAPLWSGLLRYYF